MDDQTWRFILTGGVALENPHPNPFPQWLSDKSWGEIVRASELKNFNRWMKGWDGVVYHLPLANHFTALLRSSEFGLEWKELYDSSAPHEAKLPEPWNTKLKGLDRFSLSHTHAHTHTHTPLPLLRTHSHNYTLPSQDGGTAVLASGQDCASSAELYCRQHGQTVH